MAPAARENVAEIKAKGNALFRNGDFSGAAEVFQRAVEDIRRMSSSKGDTTGLLLACLCNLAYARIKLGSMHEAEEACSQALHIQPSCAKALFRRGQARLAMGRAIEAAADFREVTALEPNNVDASSMLCRVEQKEETSVGGADGHPPAPVAGRGVHQPPRRGGHRESGCPELKPPIPASPALSTEEGKDTPTPSPVVISTRGRSCGGASSPPKTSSCCKTVNFQPHEEQSEGADQSGVEASFFSSPTSVPSFMVAGWLTSREREQGRQQQETDKCRRVDIHRPHPNAMNRDRAKADTPGGETQSAVSVSRLVSHLSASQKAAPNMRGSEGASGAATAAAQAWSSLKVEEKRKVEESTRRWSSDEGWRRHRTNIETATITTAVQHKKKNVCRKTTRERTPAVYKETDQGRGPEEDNRASAWWASLEEEECKVREKFRAKLGIREKPLTKKEGEKMKNTAARLCTDVWP